MNYLAHLYFAQPTPDSHFGNLLGDFRRGVKLDNLNESVQKALQNHYLVDRYTDRHQIVKDSVKLFKPAYRRFAPVALDILYDHFLIKSWSTYHEKAFDAFSVNSYGLLSQRIEYMPARMKKVIRHMIQNDGLSGYASLNGATQAIKHVAGRIRFSNDFAECVNDIEQHYDLMFAHFLAFFPDLINHVTEVNPELVGNK